MSDGVPEGGGGGTGGGERRLRRELGTGGAVLLGLGSILGTGVFVSLGLAAGVAGPAVLAAVPLAALLAAANGLSSAQLAAAHAVSGGTYEYGYRWLAPALGFTAGWMFLAAKSASAATAALGFAGYLLNALGAAGRVGEAAAGWRVPVALAAVAALTGVVLSGLKRSNRVNAALVVAAVVSLGLFVAVAGPTAWARGGEQLTPWLRPEPGRGPFAALLYATALVFVAYTGYGRIATLGEEVRAPRRTIPRAIVVTLGVTLVLYLAVAAAAVGAVGPELLAAATAREAAPLEIAARHLAAAGVPGAPVAAWAVAGGAVVAMLGVLLNLILGLSRVLLAMGRRGDMPRYFARLDRAGATPTAAVLAVGAVIAAIACLGDVGLTWSFSAFTVLVYYALTNLAALRLPRRDRLYPRWIAAAGLAGCLFVAFWVDPAVWLTGLGVIALGLVWHAAARRLAGTTG